LATLLVLLLACAGAGEAAAEVRIEAHPPDDTLGKIVISGPIDVFTLFDFSRAISDPRLNSSLPPLVELDSPGGSVYAAMAVGVFLRRGGLSTSVRSEGQCHSACVLILAAGVQRTAAFARVGIHRPYIPADRSASPPSNDTKERQERLYQDLRHYLTAMGAKDQLLQAILQVPPDRLRFLSLGEVAALGLDTRAGQWQPRNANDARRTTTATPKRPILGERRIGRQSTDRRVAGLRRSARGAAMSTGTRAPHPTAKRIAGRHDANGPPWAMSTLPLHRVVHYAPEPPWSATMYAGQRRRFASTASMPDSQTRRLRR
jgi:hypothetical protein